MAGEIEVVRGSPEKTDPERPFGGQSVFSLPGIFVGLTRLAPGATTPWHHHAACHFFGYVVRGTVRLEYGPGGQTATDVPEGSYLMIRPRVIHRDVNRTDDTVLVATVCVGEGPMSASVAGPDG